MLTALVLLGLVTGSSYLLSNAAAARRNATSARNLSTVNTAGVLAPYGSTNITKFIDTRNTSYIAAPNHVTDRVNAVGGNKYTNL